MRIRPLRRNRIHPWKTYVATAAIIFTLLTLRLGYLQIMKGEYYRKISSSNHIRVVATPAPRGMIIDRNGIVLADNEPAFLLSVVPSEFDETKTGLLAGLIQMDSTDLVDRLETAAAAPHRPFVIKSGMTVQDVSAVAENLYRIPGTIIDVVPLRRYPRGSDFSHLIGYVGLSETDSEYEGQITGRTGLELSLNNELKGSAGLRREVVDAYGRIVEQFIEEGREEPVQGSEIILTVDAELQRIVLEELERNAQPGAAVFIDYRTGEILSLASIPDFDPNLFTRGLTDAEWAAIRDNNENPLFARAWAATYPPASTFKVVTAAYLLSVGIISPEFMPDPCYGSLTLGETTFNCWGAHGRLNITRALAISCNTFFYRTIQLGSLDELAEMAEMFGFGSSHIEYLHGEKSGNVPTLEYLNSRYGSGRWGLGNILNICVGQGEVLATPIQLAQTAGLIASKGDMPKLHLLFDLDREYERMMPEDAVSDSTFEIIAEGMRQGVVSSEGTLHSALSGSSIEVFGKTGTAECTGEDHALVIGFTALPNSIAFCLIIEHGGYGGTVAVPVLRNILERYLQDIDEGEYN